MENASTLAGRLIAHFTFEAGEIPPTLSEFRRRAGLSLAEFDELMQTAEFSAAARDAKARYLDTLTVGALLKKYDAGFVKYLLDTSGGEEGDGQAPEGFTVEVRVVE